MDQLLPKNRIMIHDVKFSTRLKTRNQHARVNPCYKLIFIKYKSNDIVALSIALNFMANSMILL